MQPLFQILTLLLRWTITLAITGGLATATMLTMKNAADATAYGLVNLSALNHQLTGPRKHGGR